ADEGIVQVGAPPLIILDFLGKLRWIFLWDVGADDGNVNGYMECYLSKIDAAKSLADCVGHYMRPDMLRLLVDSEPKRPLVYQTGGRGLSGFTSEPGFQ
ncbi:hypothetical protein EKO27_g11689, partial [Xylaria grammica]